MEHTNSEPFRLLFDHQGQRSIGFPEWKDQFVRQAMQEGYVG